MLVKKALEHFADFHQGRVNIAAHIIGFVGLFYSVFQLSALWFAVSLVILEGGHWYNHVAGIKPYDFRPRVTFWRITVFIAVISIFYLFNKYFLR